MADSRKRRYLNNNDDPTNKKRFEAGMANSHRFLIPSKAAGAMIGKGGEVIKRLRTEHNCRIIVPDSQGPERLVMIDANPTTVINIWKDILPSIMEYMNAKDCDYKGSSSKQIEGDDEIDLRMVLHESQAGAVIGKGGERIRNLIDDHAMTIIKMYKTFCPNSTDRVLRMVSVMSNLMACLQNVFDLLENQSIKGPRKDYNPDNYDEAVAPEYGGFISKDSRSANRRGNNYPPGNAPDNFNSDEFSRPSVYSRMNEYNSSSYEDNYNMPPRSIMNNVNSQRNPIMDRGIDFLGGTMRMNPFNDSSMHLSRVLVAKHLVSAIAGPDGQRLYDLERECDASIIVDRISNNESMFIIRGSPDQIYKAQCLMQLCARKFSDDGF